MTNRVLYTKVTSITLSQKHLEILDKMIAQDRMTRAGFVRYLIAQEARDRGIWLANGKNSEVKDEQPTATN